MPQIILSSRRRADAKIEKFKPDWILSIGWGLDTHTTLMREKTMDIDMRDITPNRRKHKELPTIGDIKNIIRFAKRTAGDDLVLIHCAAGKSCSTASALICWSCWGLPDAFAVEELQKIHPNPKPNGWILAIYDSLTEANLFGATEKAGILKW